MTIRTTETSVTFRRPFRLRGVGRELPAGAYRVETDEELLQNTSFLAYQRVATMLHLPPTASSPIFASILKVDGNELEAALLRDQADVTATPPLASRPG